ncbi:hypothetical protein DRP77_11865, partial [Candidatus Poribacteria bacterium]
NVYRGEGDGELKRIATAEGRVFVDEGLREGVRYRYAVSAILGEGETPLSEPVEVETAPRPQLEGVDPLPPDRLILTFSEEMGGSAQNPSAYELFDLNAVAGARSPLRPSSALLVTPFRVMLTFPGKALRPGGVYLIAVSGLSSRKGAPLGEASVEFRIPGEPKPPSDLSLMIVHPNPVCVGRGTTRLIFDHLPPGTVISIYSMDGSPVISLPPAGPEGRVRWNLMDSSSNPVPPGVYIFRAEFEGKVRSGKVAVVR